MRAVCPASDINDGQSKGFDVEGHAFFLVKRNGEVFAYENRCAHLGINLEWQPDQFLDSEGSLIQCAMHGALFLIENGQCISGPCSGQSLTPLACEVKNGEIFVNI